MSSSRLVCSFYQATSVAIRCRLLCCKHRCLECSARLILVVLEHVCSFQLYYAYPLLSSPYLRIDVSYRAAFPLIFGQVAPMSWESSEKATKDATKTQERPNSGLCCSLPYILYHCLCRFRTLQTSRSNVVPHTVYSLCEERVLFNVKQ